MAKKYSSELKVSAGTVRISGVSQTKVSLIVASTFRKCEVLRIMFPQLKAGLLPINRLKNRKMENWGKGGWGGGRGVLMILITTLNGRVIENV